MTLREKAIQEAVRAITEQRLRFQQRWVEGGMLHAALPETPNELVARAAFDAILSVIMEPDEAMIEAGADIIAGVPGTADGADKWNANCSWKAMIRKLMGDRG